MEARSMCGWLTKAQVLGHFWAYSGIPATLSDQVISQEAQDHLEKSTREDGTEAEDKSSEAWQSRSELPGTWKMIWGFTASHSFPFKFEFPSWGNQLTHVKKEPISIS